jgi:uncharacterized membrane protein
VIPVKLEFPVDSLADELRGKGFDFTMYFAAFYLIATLWKEHAMLFDRLKQHDQVGLGVQGDCISCQANGDGNG